MLRLFVLPEAIDQDRITITGEDAHRIRKVLRLKPGELITVLDGQGKEYLTTIETIRPEQVHVRVTAQKTLAKAIFPEVTLAQGLPKGSKFELVIQKATELGVTRIMPLITMRTVPQPEDTQLERRSRRWQQIAREAAQQCRRETVPSVNLPVALDTCLKQLTMPTTVLLLWEDERKTGIKEVLQRGREVNPGRIMILVGPEGDWSLPEVEQVLSAGGLPVSLGPRVLRTETAGVVALALIMYEWGDLGGCHSD